MQVAFRVNGINVECDVDPARSLAWLLREELGLTGTKLSCEVGECGSCTVLLDGRPVTSCLVPAPQVQGCTVVTIEGLGSEEGLHPVQRAFVEQNAIQCGFCIPGMIVTAWSLLHHRPDAAPGEIRLALSGNLCRCTGYHKIVDAVIQAAREAGSRG